MLDTDQVLRARYITSETFLHAEGNPFHTRKYRDIGFPFSVGFPGNTQDVPQSHTSFYDNIIPRFYAIVLWDQNIQQNCSTEFRDFSGKILPRFHNGEMFHWVAEDHRCASAPQACFRVFFRAMVTPEGPS